jgi:hypothetical protein
MSLIINFSLENIFQISQKSPAKNLLNTLVDRQKAMDKILKTMINQKRTSKQRVKTIRRPLTC